MTTLHQFPEKLAVLRLAAGADVPEWAESSSLFSITASATETSLVCAGRSVPTKVPGDRGLIGFTLADAGESGSAPPACWSTCSRRWPRTTSPST